MGANFSGPRYDTRGCGPPRPPRHDLRDERPKLQKTSGDRPKNWTGTATNSRVNQNPVLIDARRLQKALALLSRRVNHPLPRLLFPVLIDALSGPDCRATPSGREHAPQLPPAAGMRPRCRDGASA